MTRSLLFKSTFRLILKNKVLSAIKMTGLSIGSAVFLLTSLFCISELGYDKQHTHYPRIYRYVHRVNTPEGLQSFTVTSATTGPALKERFPEVEAYARFAIPALITIRNTMKEESFNEHKFAFVDSSFLDFFSFPVFNEKKTAGLLRDPLSVVLTPSTAKKYFGSENPVGSTLLINGELLFTVTGVLKEDPSNTHFYFDFLASFTSLDAIKNHPTISKQIPLSLALEEKGYATFQTYLMLAPDANSQNLIAKFPAFIEDFRGKGKSERLKPTLQNLSSIHLTSNLLFEIKPNGSLKDVYIYFFIGLLVVAISCINYINISTAEFLNRSKGIGLKKILGVTRTSLLWTHVGETAILSAMSLLAGCVIALLLLPSFNSMVNRSLDFFTLETGVISITVFFLIVIVSGVYPAVQITKAPTLLAFKGNMNVKSPAFSLRNILVSFQLVVSFGLLTLSFLIYNQLDFLLNKTLGFDSGKIMVLDASTASSAQRDVLKKELVKNSTTTEVTMCSTPPSQSHFTFALALPENSGDDERRLMFYHNYVDADYAKALGLTLNQGRFFDASNPGDSTRYVVTNSAGAIALGDSIMNRELEIPKFLASGSNKKSIVGIFDDYNFASLHNQVQPLILEYNPAQCRFLLVRFESSSVNGVLSSVEKTWKEVVPLIPFEYYFIDDNFAKLYDNERRQKQVISGIAIIAIFLASLGITGSTLFLVERRTKEVAIRKTLGSNRSELLALLFRPLFTILVISCVLGAPIIFYFGSNWLDQYPYRIGFSPLLFLISFAIILIVVISTILYHFLKVTQVNPAQILKQGN